MGVTRHGSWGVERNPQNWLMPAQEGLWTTLRNGGLVLLALKMPWNYQSWQMM